MRKFLFWGMLGLFGGLFVLIVIAAIAASYSTPVIEVAPISPSSSAAPKSTMQPNVVPDEGTLVVGTDIKPGTYRATVPDDSYDCYWARLKGTDGSLDDIIANGNVSPGGRITVTIKKTDGAFETTGCGAWKRS